MHRYRIRYIKGDELRFIGNLDMHKVWERTFRRAGVQLAYSQGFHPQPKIQQACPLPLGFTSTEELLDFWTKEFEDPDQLTTLLINTLQPGITILELTEIDPAAPPLQTIVRSAIYHVTLQNLESGLDLHSRIQQFLKKETCIRERRGKTYDLRKLVEKLEVDSGQVPGFLVQLTALPGATGRPEELLEELALLLEDTLIERTSLIFSNP